MAVVYGVRDAKFFPLTDAGDLCTADGVAPPEYADGIDVPGVQDFTWEGEYSEGESNGDDGVCCEVSRLKKMNLTLQHCGIDPSVLAEFLGATRTAFGTGNFATSVTCNDPAIYGALVVQAVGCDDASDIHVVFYNVRWKTGPGGNFAFESFFDSTYEGTAGKAYHDCCVFYDILEHPTAIVAIPDEFDMAGVIAGTYW